MPADDVPRFLRELRELRDGAGLRPAELAARVHYPGDVIVAAEAGPSLPDLPLLSAYVRGCGGTMTEWEERWRSLGASPAEGACLPARPVGTSSAATAGARAAVSMAIADASDQRRIMEAITRASAASAAAVPARGSPMAVGTTAVGTTADAAAGPARRPAPARPLEMAASATTVPATAAPATAAPATAAATAAPRVSWPHPAYQFSPASQSGPGNLATPTAPGPTGRPRPGTVSFPHRGPLPQRTALAALTTLAVAIMCVIGGILIILR